MDRMNGRITAKESAYLRHVGREGPAYYDTHPDGCFYCGRDHVSDCCPERGTVDEYWEDA